MTVKTHTCFKCTMTFNIRKCRPEMARHVCPDCRRPFRSGEATNTAVAVVIEPHRIDEWTNGD